VGPAIDRAAFHTVMRFESKLFDYNIRLAYRKVECVNEVSEIEHRAAQACLRRCELSHDVEMNYAAELPGFTGLGTSSSFVVGLLNSLWAYRGRYASPHELAMQAIDIERNALGESVGCQDQTFAAYGGVNLIEFCPNDDIVVHRIPISTDRQREIESSLLMVFTGMTRRASDLASRQIKKVEANKNSLLSLRRMVDEGHKALTSGSVETFGKLLHEGWLIKQSLDESISTGHIGSIYQRGIDAGAFGGKLLGAGGGGFILFVVPPEKRSAVIASLPDLNHIELKINAPGSRVIHSS
jgi:D-glycero-alpha-D-manno-heptose-7-phosphate kinase